MATKRKITKTGGFGVVPGQSTGGITKQPLGGFVPGIGPVTGIPSYTPSTPPPAPTYSPSIPNIGSYLGSATGGARNAVDTGYKNRLAGLTSQEDVLGRDFGYHLNRDAEGNVSGVGDLTDDPYSKARLLQRSYDQAKRGTTNSYAARGQLYSGALQNAQDEQTFQFGGQQQAIARALSDAFAQTKLARQSAGADRDKAYADVDLTALLRLIGGA